MLPVPALVFLSVCAGVPAAASTLVVLPCDQPLFRTKLQLCLSEFNTSMETGGHRGRCSWPGAKRIYFSLAVCVELWANTSWCNRVGSLIDDFFLDVHRTYFSECGRVQDPPLGTLIMLVAPVVMTTLFLPLLCVQLTTAKQNLTI